MARRLLVLIVAVTACSPTPAPSSTSLVVTGGSEERLPATTSRVVPETDAAVASFLRCMNEAGVPASGVRIDATGHVDLTDVAKGTDVTSEAFRDALARCGPGLAAAGLLSLVGDEELSTVVTDELRQFTSCMRREGVEGFPPPRVGFDGTGPAFDPSAVPFEDPDLLDALDDCRAALVAGG